MPEIPKIGELFEVGTKIFVRPGSDAARRGISEVVINPSDPHTKLLMQTNKRGQQEFDVWRNLQEGETVEWDKVWGVVVVNEKAGNHTIIKKSDLALSQDDFPTKPIQLETKPPQPQLTVDDEQTPIPHIKDVLGDNIPSPDPLPKKTETPPAPTDALPVLAETPLRPTATLPVLVEKQPAQTETALAKLDKRANPEIPKAVAILGLDAEGELEFAATTDYERLMAETKGIFGRIWRGNIGQELIQERFFQFHTEVTKRAHMILSEQTLNEIRKHAHQQYESTLPASGFGRTWANFKDAVARNLGRYTKEDRLTLDLVGEQYNKGVFDAAHEFQARAQAVTTRFEHDFQDVDDVIRKNLKEYVHTLDPNKTEDKQLLDSIKNLMHDFATKPDEMTQKDFNAAVETLGETYHIGKDPTSSREARLYASSLYTVAKDIRARVVSAGDWAGMDEVLDKIEFRTGRAQMGAATHVESSATRKGIEWLMQRNIVGTLVANEGTAGTIVAAGLTLGILPRFVASKIARFGLGIAGGSSVAGVISGIKEFARKKSEWFRNQYALEIGKGVPQTGDKHREWVNARQIHQVEATTLIHRYTDIAYKQDGTFRNDLNEQELSQVLAHLADAKARRTISARGGENISLIRWGPAVDVTRTNLDLSIDKLQRDLGETYKDRIKLLTDAQTNVLIKGRTDAGLTDDLQEGLSILGEADDVQVEKLRRKYVLWGEAKSKGKAEGLDAAYGDIKTQIRYEAVRRGVHTATIGTLVGTGISEIGHLAGQLPDLLQPDMVSQQLAIPTHAIDVPGLGHFTDMQGLDHAFQAQIPEHTTLVADPSGTFSLMDDHNQALIHDIAIDPHGQITNIDALNAHPDALAHGLQFSNMQLGSESAEAGTTGTFDMHAPEGEWNWALNHIRDADIQHEMPADNFQKNMFRFWADSKGLDYTDTEFQNVPTYFAPDHQVEMGRMMDEAMGYHDQITASNWHEMVDKIEAESGSRELALMYKIGVVDQAPTEEEFNYLLSQMQGSTGDPVFTGVIEQSVQSTTYTATIDVIPTPAVAPLPRDTMKPSKPNGTPPMEPMYSTPTWTISTPEPEPTPEPPAGPTPLLTDNGNPEEPPTPETIKTPPLLTELPQEDVVKSRTRRKRESVPLQEPEVDIPLDARQKGHKNISTPGPRHRNVLKKPLKTKLPGPEPAPIPTPQPVTDETLASTLNTEPAPTPDDDIDRIPNYKKTVTQGRNSHVTRFTKVDNEIKIKADSDFIPLDEGEAWTPSLELLKQKIAFIAQRVNERFSNASTFEQMLQLGNVGTIGHEAFRTFDLKEMLSDRIRRLQDARKFLDDTAPENIERYPGLQPKILDNIPTIPNSTDELLALFPDKSNLTPPIRAQIGNKYRNVFPLQNDLTEIEKLKIISDNFNGETTALSDENKETVLFRLENAMLYREADSLLAGNPSIIVTQNDSTHLVDSYRRMKTVKTNYRIANPNVNADPVFELFRNPDGSISTKAWNNDAIELMKTIHEVRQDKLDSYTHYANEARTYIDELIRSAQERLDGIGDKDTKVWISAIEDHPGYQTIKDHVTAILKSNRMDFLDSAPKSITYGIITDYLLSDPEDSNLKLLVANAMNHVDPSLPEYNPQSANGYPILTAIENERTKPQVDGSMTENPLMMPRLKKQKNNYT